MSLPCKVQKPSVYKMASLDARRNYPLARMLAAEGGISRLDQGGGRRALSDFKTYSLNSRKE